MRPVLMILMLVVIAAIALVATGLININQIRGGQAPQVATTDNGVSAKAGEAPKFDVETGSVSLGTREKNVSVPKLKIEKGTAKVQVPTVKVEPAGGNATNTAAAH